MTGEGEQTMTLPDTAEPGRDEIGDGRADRRALRDRLRVVLRPDVWRRGPVVAALAVLLGLLLALHGLIPNRVGNIGSLVETFLPWFGMFVPVLLAGAVWRRSASAAVAVLFPVVAWLGHFGGLLPDKSHPGGDLTVASHNVGAANPDPVGTARALAGSGADLLALQELSAQHKDTYVRGLAAAYPYHTVLGTVGLWSRFPLSEVRPIDVLLDYGPLAATKTAEEKLAYNRALRATVATEHGPLAVYVAHLSSVRVTPRSGFWTPHRDRGAEALAKTLAAERNKRMVLLGDLNGTLDDRELDGITSRLRSAHDTAGNGFHFTWPAKFPFVRIDHVLIRGVEPKKAWVLPATTSEHRPVAAEIAW
ncbi:MAG TPA: endonuclease/exonuclease/phosphatase family protein [Spirillospora sp.]